MAKLAYATIGSNRLKDAKAFYDALFETIDVVPLFEHPSGGRVYGKDGALFFGVLGPYDKAPATPGNGTMIAFQCDTTEEVDAFYAKAIELGGTDEGAPAKRNPVFYMSYFRDLDGNKLCAFYVEDAGADD